MISQCSPCSVCVCHTRIHELEALLASRGISNEFYSSFVKASRCGPVLQVAWAWLSHRGCAAAMLALTGRLRSI